MDKRKVLVTDTTLRDGQQSLIATRMPMDDMLPILDKMDNIGFHSLEVWGGATFDACLRYLKEDPWDRLRLLKKHLKNTKLQMLFRGQNMLGYKAYPDDVVEAFIRKSVENGIDILRIFDALNDVRNIETSVNAVKKENAHAQLCISYTLSEVHTLEYYINLTKQLTDMGADSICIKDMAGLLLPYKAYELVTAMKQVTNVPIQMHCHYTSGVAAMSYLKAIEAGADVIDTSMSPFSMGTSQPATDVLVAVLKGTGFDTQLDQNSLAEISDYFKTVRDKALESGLMSTKVLGVDIATLLYQVPGGMLSNLVAGLKQQKALHKYEDVLKEIPKVRADLGYPPLVTPSSQIVGTQAFFNVMSGERYKIIPKETKDLVRGMYGKTPMQISDEIVKKIIGDEKPITVRPASLLEPEMQKLEAEMIQYKQKDEDVLTYALFPSVALEYFKYRQEQAK